MKRILVLAAALLLPGALKAQEITYALPRTTLTIVVEVRQESFFAGPYAAYAKQMLNMSVRDQDAVTSEVTRVEIRPGLEADPQAWYTCEPDNATLLALSAQGLVSLGGGAGESTRWRFLPGLRADFSDKGLTVPEKESTVIVYQEIQTDTAVVSIPVEHKVLVEKSLEDKASDAAEMILAVRRDRLNIASGNTDASYSGEAMGQALQELGRIEEEYMALFRGYSIFRTRTYTFEVIPASSGAVQRQMLFCLTDDGPVETFDPLGTPYYLQIDADGALPEEESADRKKGRTGVRYRIPMVCRVALSRRNETLLQTRIPVYQLGREATLYIYR